MKKILEKLSQSFDNGDAGFSSKKLTAFSIVVCVLVAHCKWIAMGNFEQLEMVLTIDFSFISLLYGINVTDKKINKKEDEKIAE